MSSSRKDTRERILQTTWRLLEKNWRQDVRLEDIAREAGVSRQAIYLHFGSRTALFIATVRYVDDVLHFPQRVQEACASGNGYLGIEAFTVLWANYMPEIYGLAKALLALRDTDEAAAAAWNDRMQALHQGCAQIVECLRQNGTLAPQWTVETGADIFWAMISLATWEHLTVERGWSQEQYIERMQWMLWKTLTTGDGDPLL